MDHTPVLFPLWTVFPFLFLLLGIALLPLFAHHFWHSNFNKAMYSLLLSLPVAGYLFFHQQTTGNPGLLHLRHALWEYANFMVLLGSLYTVSGGIVFEGNLKPTPILNTFILMLGAVLANLVGTTGASMLLIRPMLRINLNRTHKTHVPIFFIFVVSNLGGLLTPLGDPPLFLGFLRGVDFFWPLVLTPHWLVANGLALAVFFVWDTWASKKEKDLFLPLDQDNLTLDPDISNAAVRFRGVVNFLFLGGIVLSLIFLEKIDQTLNTWIKSFLDSPELPWGVFSMALMAFLSLCCTPHFLRQANDFTWGAIVEVAVLFAGIFITMVPPLKILEIQGQDLGLIHPWEYFWCTGVLSSVLDNAPTFLTFATIAAEGPDLGVLMTSKPLLLQAVSCGAVFMGSLTYIGNGPNFMVKAIAESSGYRTPSFFGYLAYSGPILLPIFGLITYLFFVH